MCCSGIIPRLITGLPTIVHERFRPTFGQKGTYSHTGHIPRVCIFQLQGIGAGIYKFQDNLTGYLWILSDMYDEPIGLVPRSLQRRIPLVNVTSYKPSGEVSGRRLCLTAAKTLRCHTAVVIAEPAGARHLFRGPITGIPCYFCY